LFSQAQKALAIPKSGMLCLAQRQDTLSRLGARLHKCISQNYIRGSGKIRVFARRSPSKLIEAFARIFPLPLRNFGICTKRHYPAPFLEFWDIPYYNTVRVVIVLPFDVIRIYLMIADFKFSRRARLASNCQI
jgi:hypothetical protein